MEIVLLTALGVGGATIFGSVIGFVFKGFSQRFSDIVLSFAAGIMLAASVLGLILPSLEYGGKHGIVIASAGILTGAVSLNMLDKLVPHIRRLVEPKTSVGYGSNLNKILLFVVAIAIHNLPEGLAAGVGFGSGNDTQAIIIAGGIALQNIPEGMVIISPMLAAGISAKKTFIYALFTGIIEVIGTMIGYFAVSVSTVILPFALSFAGGTMLYVISDEMIPETHSEYSHTATYSLLIGFCLMLILNAIL